MQVYLTKNACFAAEQEPNLCLDIHQITGESQSGIFQLAFPIDAGFGIDGVVVLKGCGPTDSSDDLVSALMFHLSMFCQHLILAVDNCFINTTCVRQWFCSWFFNQKETIYGT